MLVCVPMYSQQLTTKKQDHTRLIVVCVWTVLASVQVHQLHAAGSPCPAVDDPTFPCECYQYLDGDTCRNCTDCAATGHWTVKQCTKSTDAKCSNCTNTQFFNATSERCQNCTVCKIEERENDKCTLKTDTVCQSRCQSHQYYDPLEGRCHFNCELCEHGCVTERTTRCRCLPSECYADTDVLCRDNMCSATEATSLETTGTVNSKSNDLPTWGIGLISIGVVIAIVAFSAGSMILSFCTRKTSQIVDEESDPTDDSKPVFVGRFRSGMQTGHSSPFLPHNLLQNSRYSPSRTNGIRSNSLRTNSLRNHPNALRSMQVPRPENATPI